MERRCQEELRGEKYGENRWQGPARRENTYYDDDLCIEVSIVTYCVIIATALLLRIA